MKSTKKPSKKPILAKPTDLTFEAYRDFVKSFFENLTGKPWDENETSDEQIRQSWEKAKRNK